MDHTKLGPFKIKRKLSNLTFELDLPPTMKIHPVFHKLLLKLYYNLIIILGLIEIDEEI